MKKIPCPRCRMGAIGPATPAYPDGAPVVFGRFTGGPDPIVVKCYRCKMSFKMDAREYARLPTMTVEETKELGLER